MEEDRNANPEESITEQANATEPAPTEQPEHVAATPPTSPERPQMPIGCRPPPEQDFSPGVYRRLRSGLYEWDDTASASASSASSMSGVILGGHSSTRRERKKQKRQKKAKKDRAVRAQRSLRVLERARYESVSLGQQPRRPRKSFATSEFPLICGNSLLGSCCQKQTT
jgi:hypothetical protein